ncbi:hypothetical protein TIFTF001_014235 [Ficus carica]|uniref:Uncharacterized protein n=1 Tax=Ficus carica TaxID=3494 RepID=A0AA87ZWE8_FICCA|nr:hypothetical protein TIFTF001_014235 [Ficus carica]
MLGRKSTEKGQQALRAEERMLGRRRMNRKERMGARTSIVEIGRNSVGMTIVKRGHIA